MFLAILLGLAATTAALPLVREVANENEGVNLPIYKSWFNPYSSNVFGSQYASVHLDRFFPNYFTQEKRYPLNNYDSINISPFVYRPNYFWKYLLPNMMNMGNRYDIDMDMFVRNSIQSRFFNSANNYNYMFGNMDFSKNTDMYDMNNSNYMYGPYSPEYMYGSMFYPYFYTNKPNYFYRPYFHQLMNTLMPYNMGTSDYMYRPFSLEYMNGYMPNFMNMRYPYYMSNNAMNNYFDYQTNRPYPNKLMFGNINNFQNMFYPFDKEYEYFITPQVMNFKNTLYPFQNYMNEYNFPYMPYSLEYMDGLTEHFKNMGVRLSNYMNDYDYMYRMYSPEYVHFQKVYNQFKGNNLDYMNRPYFPGYLENVVDMSYPTNNMLGFSYTNRPNYLGGNMQGVEYMNRRYFPVHMIRYVNNYRYPFYNGMNMENPFYNMNFGGMNFGANQFPDNTNYMT